ncbi:hypothetical protein IKF63_02000 [Candidatus Saccharibacteria bacterium]|nr:hypothetical protein [Candidatus Saccharibacteria bacterium]
MDSFAASFDCVKRGGPLELTLKHPNHETLRGKVRIDAIYSVRHLDMTGNSFEVMGECRPYDAKGTRTFLSQYDTKKKSGWLQYDEVRKAEIYK